MKRKQYTKEGLEQIAKKTTSISEMMRELDIDENGGNRSTIKKKLLEFSIDTSHFLGSGYMKGKPALNRLSWKDVLVLRKHSEGREDAFRLRRALIESGRNYICELCNQPPIWLGKELRLHVDHIDGNKLNNCPSNVRFLCPHCHSQTEGFCGSMGLTDVESTNRYLSEYRKHGNRRNHI